MRTRAGESIFYDFIKEGEDTTDSETATYQILDSNKEVVLTSQLELNENTFMLRIPYDDTNTLKSGQYTLLVAYSNSDTGYYDYIMDEILEVV